MFELTHQEAQHLLQNAADQTLRADDKSALDAHLEKCVECSSYAKNLTALESGLRKVLHAQLDSRHPSLDLQAITNPAHSTWTAVISPAHILGKVTIVTTLLLGYFIISNLLGGQLPITGNETPTMVPTPGDSKLVFTTSPTPSSPSTLIGLTQGCEIINYIVKEDDTLESIAFQFTIPEKIITEYNNLKTDDPSPGKALSIPICNHTPSQAEGTHTNKMTITPLSETVLPTQRE